MHVKITSGSVDTYPYNVGKLRRDNPNTSFPKKIPDDMLAGWGVYPVTFTAQPAIDDRTQKVEQETAPTLVGSDWTVGWTVTNKTAEEVQEYDNGQAASVRSQRDGLLAETDWIITKETEQAARDGLGLQIPSVWLDYRQALRDITGHANFPHLAEADWPTKPE